MDDTCAVCAESLEWVAYGSCGHKEVCSTCVARLRFICSDRRCCICKTESTLIFVTKALGDYTKMISDFSIFPSEDKEGRSGSYWYHEDTQAYFDDLDQYKMVKAMCRLSCSVCDKMEENTSSSSKRRARFRDINQLKGHLFHQHRLFMCSLCLEGRKVFICEQKLYSKSQLKQHINTGDSEVDGTESERGGFQGHPLCEFCRSPFYGDNELYTHMSTEHYTCHICQRQNPGQYEYYKNYDDLEIHFRQDHFLCEDEACLSKKFIVFTSESEMKRHNALEHGGRMSRSKRNAVLQLPTSFTYRRSNEQDNRRGRRNTFQRDLSESELSRAIEASLETANVNARFQETSSSDHVDNVVNGIELIQPFEALGNDSDPPSRYLMAVSHRPRNAPLAESAFPPLSTGSSQKPLNDSEGLPRNNTMADNLRRHNKKKVNVLNSATQAWPAATRLNNPSVSRPLNGSLVISGPSKSKSSVSSGQPSLVQPPQPAAGSSSSSSSWKSTNRISQSSAPQPAAGSDSSSSSWKSTSRISHSSSAPNLVDTGPASDFPPVSSALQTNGQGTQKVYAANKSMVEKIRAGLNNDEEKFSAFKEISGEYRQGKIDAEMYLVYVEQFGLSHLVVDLARLCPDPQKEKELIAVYNANKTLSKGKSVVGSGKKISLTDSILSNVRELQSRPPEQGEVETLSKDGYRANKGKSKVDDRTSPGGQVLVIKSKKEDGDDDGQGRSKPLPQQQRKKTSKFHRVRLGDGSMAAVLDLRNSKAEAEPEADGNEDPGGDGLPVPVRGVWRNGGGHKLIQKRPS